MHRRLITAAVLVAGSLFVGGCTFGDSDSDNTSSPSGNDKGSASAGTLQQGESSAKPKGNTAGSTVMVRFDGIYMTRQPDSNDTIYAVRYFESGSACAVGTTPDARADQIAKWLKPGNPKAAGNCGTYDRATGNFTIDTTSTVSNGGKIDYKLLKMGGNQIVLQPTSHVPGYEGTKLARTYKFTTI